MKLLIGILLLAAVATGTEVVEEEKVFEIDLPKRVNVARNEDLRFNFGHTASINEYMDNALDSISRFMIDNGLDPLALPDLEEGVYFKPLFITYSARVALTQGVGANLSKISRNGENQVNYFAQMLRARIALRISDIQFQYRYATKVMNIGPTGGAVGALAYIDVLVDVLIDFNNDEIHLQTFAFEDYGRLTLRLTGNFLTDWFVNPFVQLFTSLLRGTVFGFVEDAIRTVLIDTITSVNQNIKDILSSIEAPGARAQVEMFTNQLFQR